MRHGDRRGDVRAGTRHRGSGRGLTAATFLAVAPLHVRDSHYVKHDVPVTLLIVLGVSRAM